MPSTSPCPSSSSSAFIGSKSQINKHEFVRLIIEYLYSLGYKKSASLLESESNIPFKSSQLLYLESQILNSNFDNCVETLNNLDNLNEETRSSALFLVLKHSMTEFLTRGDDLSALSVLRKQVSLLGIDKEKVHKLASVIVCSEDKELGKINGKANGNSCIEDLRRRLVVELEELLPPPITVPKRRLGYLVETALIAQRDSCIYHNSRNRFSLYEDHCCGRDQVPTETVQILDSHENEVWFVQFSNSGEYLASSSSDCTAIIWKVSKEGILSLKHTLRSHQNPVSFVSWSPDDTMLLTCGNGEVLKLWDVETGTCKHTFGEKSPIVSSCAWLPDSKRLVCGSSDPNKCIYMWDLDGNELEAWRGVRMPKVSDLAVTPDGKYLISIFSEKDIRLYSFHTKTERVIKEEHPITSLSVSRDSKFLIVNLNSQEIHFWDIVGTGTKPLKYTGHKQGKYVIRSCFGGVDCMFLASGSENSQVYIWNRRNQKPIEVLTGHSMTVNCVSWNPTQPQMLASASDDQTIRIWGPSRTN
ncbi:Wd repeat-containing protein wds-like protein [Thalictrum thalictroides]|uniref:Wd repeat-containing protein wds-like protein n=1 Tax=Thalictrum thalictroides TaxID=46969 RepID=A0A7J6V0W3_THATH|nr:Wd repeat-containing protein wds-like protein [Thalictrum thalictroides]